MSSGTARQGQPRRRADPRGDGAHEAPRLDVELFDRAVAVVIGREADQQIAVRIQQQRSGLRRISGGRARADRRGEIDKLAGGFRCGVVLHDLVMAGRITAQIQIRNQEVAVAQGQDRSRMMPLPGVMIVFGSPS